jgi:hypothetical protein
MQKIVINKCYGGFSLSIKAQEKLLKLGCPHTSEMPANEYFGKDDNETNRQEHSRIYGVAYRNKKVIQSHHYDYDKERACPILIKVVQLLGDKANTPFSNLKIVEIPDGVDFIIDEYDGVETVEEAHRSWG